MTMRQKVLGVLPDGSARIRTYILVTQVTGPADVTKAMSKMKSMTFVMTIGKDGKVSKAEGWGSEIQGLGFDPSQFVTQMGAVFPARGLNVGDTWSGKVPVVAGGGDINVVSKLVSVGEVGNQATAKIDQTMKGHINLAELMKAMAGSAKGKHKEDFEEASSMNGTMDITGNGETFFSPALGKMIKSNVNENTTMNITLPPGLAGPDAPSAMQEEIHMTMKMERIK